MYAMVGVWPNGSIAQPARGFAPENHGDLFIIITIDNVCYYTGQTHVLRQRESIFY